MGFVDYLRKIRDPSTLAVMLEDSGACLGVVMAIIGIGMSQATANPMYDSVGGMSISILLAAMGLALARLNERYLLGQAVDSDIVDGKGGDARLLHASPFTVSTDSNTWRLIFILIWCKGIKQMLLSRPGIDNVQSVQSQWVGPYTFAYKVNDEGR